MQATMSQQAVERDCKAAISRTSITCTNRAEILWCLDACMLAKLRCLKVGMQARNGETCEIFLFQVHLPPAYPVKYSVLRLY